MKRKIIILATLFFVGAFFISPVEVSAYSWEQVGQGDFGSVQNKRASRFIEFENKLYAVIQNCPDSTCSTQIWYTSDGSKWYRATSYPENYTDMLLNDVEVMGGYLYVAQSNGGAGDTVYIYRSSDGINWSSSVIDNRFGDVNNIRILDLKSSGGYLYAVTANFETGFEVWRSSTGASGSWSQVVDAGFGDANNITAGMDDFNGKLYLATVNLSTGAEIWSSTTGGSGTWSQLGVDGLDPVNKNYGVNMSAEFDDSIYFLAYRNLNQPVMWRSSDGTNFSQVSSAGLDISFAGDDAAIGMSGTVIGNRLWLGMTNTTTGAKLKYSTDGANWIQEGDIGFGNANNRWLHPIIYFNNQIYVGFDNITNGASIWRTVLDSASGPLPETGADNSFIASLYIGASICLLMFHFRKKIAKE